MGAVPREKGKKVLRKVKGKEKDLLCVYVSQTSELCSHTHTPLHNQLDYTNRLLPMERMNVMHPRFNTTCGSFGGVKGVLLWIGIGGKETKKR